MNNKLIYLTLFFLLTLPVNASEISGSFGKAFGEVYQGEKSVLSETTSGEKIYRFIPQNPHPAFTKYGVILTPKTQKITEIWAWGYFDNSSKCKAKFKLIEVLLDKKYENLKSKNSFSIDSSNASYSSGNRRISLRCPIEFGDTPLYLQYIDKDMQRLAIEEEAEDQNSDGF